MKKLTKTESQLLQKLHQAWCKNKHHIGSLIIVSVPVYVVMAVTIAIHEYYETGIARGASTITGSIGILYIAYVVWRRLFATPGEELVIHLSVHPNEEKHLALQIGQASYSFRPPYLILAIIFVAVLIIPEIMMPIISAIGLAIAYFCAAVIVLLLAPLILFIIVTDFCKKISKLFQKAQ